ncbi:hypothetical protein DMH25_00340 [Streptomyces sp. WAC 01325]|uniref:NACHT domain-containing protein n=1 Tax=Streptomyces sp. WAC 01325 TaxID=2203202 RepID=UPI000F881ADF|nr:NACHT domain-containing protein [Streptomyces sp. WAC 01325]RSN18744.1 hypothetical protein DMH25_00340 [Streptomyces sp. WAC 01325]
MFRNIFYGPTAFQVGDNNQQVNHFHPPQRLPSEEAIAEAMEVLTAHVTEQWRNEARIQRLDDHPIPVHWDLTANLAVMDTPARVFGDAPAVWSVSGADIAMVAACFRTLRRRRLVVLGRAGSGKTTLAVQLLRQLLATRADDEPVPVLLPVAQWDVDSTPDLRDWLADQLTRMYPALAAEQFGSHMARILVMREKVLPVLDGLDEVSDPARHAVLAGIDRSLTAADQVILTCRPHEYAHAVGSIGRLTAAAVIEPRPLSARAAADYLADHPRRPLTPAWDEVLSRLRAGDASPLADVVSAPLGLWLMSTIYTARLDRTDPQLDPAQLVDPTVFPTAAVLRAHLFDHLIPATLATRPPSDDPARPFQPRRRWKPGPTARYLGLLAERLEARHTHDIAWWGLHEGIPLRERRLTAGIGVGLCVAVPAWLLAALIEGPVRAIRDALVVGILTGALATAASIEWEGAGPGYLRVSLRGTVRTLLLGGVGGSGVGALVGLAAGFLARSSFAGVLAGLLTMFALTVVIWLGEHAEHPLATDRANTPLSTWRADRAVNITRITLISLTGGLAFGLVTGLVYGPAAGLLIGLVGGPAGALYAGDHHAWKNYLLITLHLPGRRRELPRQLMPFLDDVHRLGLLRAVGPVYQFRHADLQHHLAVRHRRAKNQPN